MLKDYNLINRAIKLQNGANAHHLLTLLSVYNSWHINLKEGCYWNEKEKWIPETKEDVIRFIKQAENELRVYVCQEEKKCLNLILN